MCRVEEPSTASLGDKAAKVALSGDEMRAIFDATGIVVGCSLRLAVGYRAFEGTTFGASPLAIQRDLRSENSKLP
jgi:hypothetical protein